MQRKKADNIFNIQKNSLRDPIEVISSSWKDSGVFPESVKFNVTDGFVNILKKQNITLYVSREYENFLLSINSNGNKIEQRYFPLPHPSGIAVNRKENKFYVASTRNPNQIVEFTPSSVRFKEKLIALPSRIKYYCGSHYFHDLAIIQNKIYANAVGKNGIIQINMNESRQENLIWWPACIDKKDCSPDTSANHLQLNSIAAGETFNKSFFTASGSHISRRKPGHQNYPVDKRGVVFSASSRDVIAKGLCRPHSAKLYKGKIWLHNSGYGEFGYIENGKFEVLLKLPGWTRGLCIVNDIAFVGISRILPRFSQYAPGLKNLKKQQCGILAVDLNKGKVIGSILWPYGNQIFAIEWSDGNKTGVFLYDKIQKTTLSEKNFYFNFK